MMDGPTDYYTKWSQKDKKKILYDITYMWTLEYSTNRPIS